MLGFTISGQNDYCNTITIAKSTVAILLLLQVPIELTLHWEHICLKMTKDFHKTRFDDIQCWNSIWKPRYCCNIWLIEHMLTPKVYFRVLGPVVQRVVSLTSSLRVISLTVLAESIHNILIFFAEKMWVAFALQKLLTFFSAKNFSTFAYHLM